MNSCEEGGGGVFSPECAPEATALSKDHYHQYSHNKLAYKLSVFTFVPWGS